MNSTFVLNNCMLHYEAEPSNLKIGKVLERCQISGPKIRLVCYPPYGKFPKLNRFLYLKALLNKRRLLYLRFSNQLKSWNHLGNSNHIIIGLVVLRASPVVAFASTVGHTFLFFPTLNHLGGSWFFIYNLYDQDKQ